MVYPHLILMETGASRAEVSGTTAEIGKQGATGRWFYRRHGYMGKHALNIANLRINKESVF